MAPSERRQQLNQRLHGLRWKLVAGSGAAFAGVWLLIAAQTVSASAPADTQSAPAPQDTSQADQVTQPSSPQVSNAAPNYPPLVKTRRS